MLYASLAQSDRRSCSSSLLLQGQGAAHRTESVLRQSLLCPAYPQLLQPKGCSDGRPRRSKNRKSEQEKSERGKGRQVIHQNELNGASQPPGSLFGPQQRRITALANAHCGLPPTPQRPGWVSMWHTERALIFGTSSTAQTLCNGRLLGGNSFICCWDVNFFGACRCQACISNGVRQLHVMIPGVDLPSGLTGSTAVGEA